MPSNNAIQSTGLYSAQDEKNNPGFYSYVISIIFTDEEKVLKVTD